MKNLNLFLLFLFLGMVEVSAQTAEKLVNAKIKELSVLGIDTVLTYRDGCSGCEFILGNSPCETKDYLYLVWADKTHNYIQRFDPCYHHEPVADEMNGVINLLRKHLPELIKEELKPPKELVKIDGKDVVSTVEMMHDDYYIYTINLSGTLYRKVISSNNLYTKVFGGNENSRNINYSYNQSTYLKQLNDFVGKRIEGLYRRLTEIKK